MSNGTLVSALRTAARSFSRAGIRRGDNFRISRNGMAT
jgi:hypothetical protein